MNKVYTKKNKGHFYHNKIKSVLVIKDKKRTSIQGPQHESCLKEKTTPFYQQINTSIEKTKNLNEQTLLRLTNDTSFVDQSLIMKKKQKWKKVSNLFRSVSLFKNINVKPIKSETELEKDLLSYNTQFCIQTKKSRERTPPPPRRKEEEIENFKKIVIEANNINKKRRETFKEEVEFHILHNNINPISSIKEIYKNNPDKPLISESNPEFIFNTPLEHNGMTLLYLASREGKIEIVNFFLDKKLDAKIPSKIDSKNFETPLECACRWGYTNIVKLFLDKVKYTKKEIEKVMKVKGISNNIILLLSKYLEKINKQKQRCYCW